MFAVAGILRSVVKNHGWPTPFSVVTLDRASQHGLNVVA
jgi:hypothetical protein